MCSDGLPCADARGLNEPDGSVAIVTADSDVPYEPSVEMQQFITQSEARFAELVRDPDASFAEFTRERDEIHCEMKQSLRRTEQNIEKAINELRQLRCMVMVLIIVAAIVRFVLAMHF